MRIKCLWSYTQVVKNEISLLEIWVHEWKYYMDVFRNLIKAKKKNEKYIYIYNK